MIKYSNFEIEDLSFRIFKNGKHVFTAEWQKNTTQDQAKRMIDSSLLFTNYENWQQEKYGDVAKLVDTLPDGTNVNGTEEMKRLEEWVGLQDGECELENGAEEAERFTDWNNEQAELQREEMEF